MNSERNWKPANFFLIPFLFLWNFRGVKINSPWLAPVYHGLIHAFLKNAYSNIQSSHGEELGIHEFTLYCTYTLPCLHLILSVENKIWMYSMYLFNLWIVYEHKTMEAMLLVKIKNKRNTISYPNPYVSKNYNPTSIQAPWSVQCQALTKTTSQETKHVVCCDVKPNKTIAGRTASEAPGTPAQPRATMPRKVIKGRFPATRHEQHPAPVGSRRPLTSAWQILVIKACMERPDTPLNDIFIKPLFSRAFLQPAKSYHFQKFSAQHFYNRLSFNFSCYMILIPAIEPKEKARTFA